MSIKLCFIIRMRMVQQTITIGCVSVQVPPTQVGPHASNRGTTGLCYRRCHKLLFDLTDAGFSDEATNPYAIEDDDELSNAKFALDLTKKYPRPGNSQSYTLRLPLKWAHEPFIMLRP